MFGILATMSLPLLASSTAGTVSSFLAGVTELLTWTLASATSIVTWCLGNPLAFVYLGMFVTGFAASFLFRIFRSL